MENQNYIVISLGGSLIVPDAIDAIFVKEFVVLIGEKVSSGSRFAIIAGGGKTCRRYNEALETIASPTPEDLDWLGISGTRLNAEFVRLAFGSLAEPAIFLDPHTPTLTDKPVLVGGGYKPGHSSDGSAVVLAKTLGAKKLINLSNIDYVYTADPRTNPDAVKIEKTSWKDFRTLLPEEWNPGINAPFDPVAARMAEELGLEVAIMNGKNLDNLRDYLDGKPFIGTVIS
jgi:uridylate kinase